MLYVSSTNLPESCEPGGGPVNWLWPDAVVPVPLAGAGVPVGAGAGVPVDAGALGCWAPVPAAGGLAAAGGGSSLGISGIPYKYKQDVISLLPNTLCIFVHVTENQNNEVHLN